MSACLQLREPGIAPRPPLVPAARFPGMPAAWVGVECDVCPRQLTAVECRPFPWRSCAASEWTRFPAALAPLHPGPPGAGCCIGATVTCASAPCSVGHEQFRDLTSCARLSPEPGGRDLAEVALADLAMTRPWTVRPHLGRYGLSGFFSNLACELESPVTESNRRPSPYHGDALPTELTGRVFTC